MASASEEIHAPEFDSWLGGLESFTRALKLLQYDKDVLARLSQTALRVGDPDQLASLMSELCGVIDKKRTFRSALFELIVGLIKLGHSAEADRHMFAAIDSSSNDESIVRCNRLIAQERFAEAVDVLNEAAAGLRPRPARRLARRLAPQPSPQPITHLVLHNGHHLLRHAAPEDLAAACGLPVRLIDAATAPPSAYAAPDALVILPSFIRHKAVDAMKAWCPASRVVCWDFDNHHSYLRSVQMLQAVDVFFPVHPTPIDYLPGWDSRKSLGPLIPLAIHQWSREMLSRLHGECRDIARTDALMAHFTFYPVALRRNRFLAEIAAEWPDADLRIGAEGHEYHAQGPLERFLMWRRRKTSLALPVSRDLSVRVFDALAAGQVPIVPRDIPDFDRVVSEEDQARLPVIRLEAWTVVALREAHAQAIAAFDRGGEAQAGARSLYVRERHMLAHRIKEIAERAAGMCGLQLQRQPR